MPVHMAGQPVDMDAICDIARRHDLVVIEDAAHAIGAEYAGQRIGNIDGSLAACYSFYPTKNMTTIEGGAVLTNDDEFAERCRLYSLHGISKDAWKRYSNAGYQHWDTLLPGFKYNMTDIQAALGLHQIKKLDGFIDTRAALRQTCTRRRSPTCPRSRRCGGSTACATPGTCSSSCCASNAEHRS